MQRSAIRSLALVINIVNIVSIATLPHLGVAQQSSPAPPTGTVTGHVTCGDTQRPAKFAQVILFGVPGDLTPLPKPGTKPDTAQIAATLKATMGSLNMVQTQSGVDGSFTAVNVAPGDYYVFASIPGYVQPKNVVQAAYDAGADLSKPIPGVPIVHVAANRSAQADLTVERGAAVSGKLVWDDGTPVTRAIVTVVSQKGKEKKLPSQFAMLAVSSAAGGGGLASISDDLGHFRIAGLAPGDYLVKAMLQTHSQFSMQAGVMNLNGMVGESPLIVFAPAAFHEDDAKPVTLHSSEDHTDEDMAINLDGLHSVSGHLASVEDHHSINSGMVTLKDTQDKDFSRSSGIDANGNFTVTFVPSGTYNLLVTNAEDTEPSQKKPTGLVKFVTDHTVRSYQDAKQSVIVSGADVTGQNIELAPAKVQKKDVDLNELLKQ